MTYFATSYETDPDVRLLMLDEITAVSGGTAMEEDMEYNDAFCTFLTELRPFSSNMSTVLTAVSAIFALSGMVQGAAAFAAVGALMGVTAAVAEASYNNWCAANS